MKTALDHDDAQKFFLVKNINFIVYMSSTLCSLWEARKAHDSLPPQSVYAKHDLTKLE